jgi:hypothetical protein
MPPPGCTRTCSSHRDGEVWGWQAAINAAAYQARRHGLADRELVEAWMIRGIAGGPVVEKGW